MELELPKMIETPKSPAQTEFELQLEMAAGRGAITALKMLEKRILKAKNEGILITGAFCEKEISDFYWEIEKKFRSRFARKV